MSTTLIVSFCLTLNPYLCYELRMVPEDYRAISSPMECIRGGAIGGMTFVMEHAEYTVKGWRCISSPPKPTDITRWVQAEQARMKRLEPQIK